MDSGGPRRTSLGPDAGASCSSSRGSHTHSTLHHHPGTTSTTTKPKLSPILPRCLRRQSSCHSTSSSYLHQAGGSSQSVNRTTTSSHLRPSRLPQHHLLQQDSRPGSASSTSGADPASSSPSSPLNQRKSRVRSVVNTKRITTFWSNLKHSSPVQRAKNSLLSHRPSSSSRLVFGKSKLKHAGRHSFSSPNISCYNLAEAAAAGNAGDGARRANQSDGDVMGDRDCGDGDDVTLSYCHESPVPPSCADSPTPYSYSERDRLLNDTPIPHYPFFLLEVNLISGSDLLAKDSGGTSDPYVKFRLGSSQLFRSKTINKTLHPVWNENFSLILDNVRQLLVLDVFDHDFGFRDDYLGTGTVDLSRLKWNEAIEVNLGLTETGKEDEDNWGYIKLGIRLQPKTQEEKDTLVPIILSLNKLFGRNTRINYVVQNPGGGFGSGSLATRAGSATGITEHKGMIKKQKTQIWSSVANIILIEGKGLSSKDENGLSDPYIKFKLGAEKHKSKVIPKSLNPVWNEQFDLHMYSEQTQLLEGYVYDKDSHGRDDFMGKFTLDLSRIEREETHNKVLDLEGGEGSVHLVITISGILKGGSSQYSIHSEDECDLPSKYGLLRSFANMDDVGYLIVKVYRAEGLAVADFGGKSDPFCVLQLVNTRLQTNTEYKTLSPEWNKVFTFRVRDIHEALDVTVYDEDRDKKVEFLGRVLIPLLRLRNGQKAWYALKDKKCMTRAKGNIWLEMTLYHNPVRACWRTINPREERFLSIEQKFKRSVFVRNVMRVKGLVMEIVDIIKYINSCFQWESVPRSVTAFFLFMLIVYYFEGYMVPVFLLIIFSKYYVWQNLSTRFAPSTGDEEGDGDFFSQSVDDGDEDDPGEKKTIRERLQTVQEITALVQNVLGEIASLGERVKNTFNFSVPFLSYFAIVILTVASIILYFVPLRYLLMAWGVNKFTKKLRNPNAINNNELMDFLSRVVDNDEKMMHRELKLLPVDHPPDSTNKKKKTT